jgi:hypothetical protein
MASGEPAPLALHFQVRASLPQAPAWGKALLRPHDRGPPGPGRATCAGSGPSAACVPCAGGDAESLAPRASSSACGSRASAFGSYGGVDRSSSQQPPFGAAFPSTRSRGCQRAEPVDLSLAARLGRRPCLRPSRDPDGSSTGDTVGVFRRRSRDCFGSPSRLSRSAHTRSRQPASHAGLRAHDPARATFCAELLIRCGRVSENSLCRSHLQDEARPRDQKPPRPDGPRSGKNPLIFAIFRCPPETGFTAQERV